MTVKKINMLETLYEVKKEEERNEVKSNLHLFPMRLSYAHASHRMISIFVYPMEC